MLKSVSAGERVFDGVNLLLLLMVGVIMLFPFYYIIIVSFTPYAQYLQSSLVLWPKHWVLDSYRYLLAAPLFVRSVGNSIYVTVVGTFVSLLLTSSMAYSLSRNILGKRVYMFLVMFTFVFGGGLIPSYLVVKWTGLLNTYWALIIPGAVNSFNLIVMRQFFMEIPTELTEAAMIDGANDLQIFLKLMLPLSKPALAAFGLFYAVGQWNSYFNAILYLNNPLQWTVQVVLRQLVILQQPLSLLPNQAQVTVQNVPPETIGMAAILVATLPILIVYPFVQKHFAKGVMVGAIKG